MSIVQTYELSKYFSRGKVKALQDCSLKVAPGQIFSLLGPNGAGKTTLIKILLGILHPTRGHAKILGHPISHYPMHAQIGYLAENHRFPEFLNANQVLTYYGKMSGVDTKTLGEKIPKLLKQVNLSEWRRVKIKKFSKGMLQRLGLAHALLNDPQLLFLDEPTDGIDPIGRREIRDLLQQLREQGKTVFLNSHLLSEVERISDEVAILKNGKVLRKGRVADFITIKEQFQLKINAETEIFNRICQQFEIAPFAENEHFVISVHDTTHLNQLIDALRQEKIEIAAIIPRKISLEDYFIEVIEDKNGGNE